MYCPKCERLLPDDSTVCTNCSFEISNKTNEKLPNETQLKPQPKTITKNKIIVLVAVCLIAILCVFLIINIINESGKASLKKELMRDWDRTEFEDNIFYTLELDFSDDEVEYNFNSTYVDDTIATYKYSVISKNKIKIDDRDIIYTVEFNDDKTLMTITPALTSTDSFEHWFNFDN